MDQSLKDKGNRAPSEQSEPEQAYIPREPDPKQDDVDPVATVIRDPGDDNS
jgi:hypothetical protein